MSRKWFVALVFWLFYTGWGVGHCLAVLNHALGPEKEVRAVALDRLAPRLYQVDLLGFAFTLELPEKPRVLAARLREKAFTHLKRLQPLRRIEP